MSTGTLPGRPGNLTAEQEEKLRQLWQLIFQVCGIAVEKPSDEPAKLEETPSAETSKKAKKSRMGFLKRGKKDTDAGSTSEAAEKASAHPVILGNHGDEDKHGQVKHFYDTLSSQSPEFIRQTIWSMIKHDHPDALALRFLRARKWDVEKALIMFISTINWRATDMKVDEDIMRNGEGAALEAENGSEGPAKTLAHDFLAQMRMGKSYLHGCDKQGRPICVVRVRLHKAGEQVEESLERYTVYLIETTRMMLNPPVDTATILFDMTGFSMANMDYTPVKFMIKCFEANYPESLGTVLVHNAPWIFQGIWRVIKGWLDPVVASKINFTNNVKDLEAFIDRSKIPKDLEGDEDWSYKYIESVPGENDKMKDTATRDRLVAGREQLYKEYEDATLDWIHHPDSAEIKNKRNEIAKRLKEDYWVLDPYIRARSLYDRIGILQPGGKVDFYPPPSSAPAVAAVTSAMAAATVTDEAVAEKTAAATAVSAPARVPVAVSDDDID
ncbi:putative phosphatidylinositol transfer protein csr1 protein [Naviculisporaceae sp. PSN 640]